MWPGVLGPSSPAVRRSPSGGRRRRGRRGGRVPGGAGAEAGSPGGDAPRCAAATLDVRRALLADLRSYGSRRDLRLGVSLRGGASGRGAHPARCLGRRLAAGLELVRTRGIRLFN